MSDGASASRAPVPEDGPPSGRATYLKLAGLILLVVAAFLGARALGFFQLDDPAALADQVRALRERRHVAPLFVALYALATAIALPGSILTIAGGAIFGFQLGSLLNWAGASLGAMLAYLLARQLGLDAVRRLLGSRAARVTDLAGAHGFTTVLRLRLVPVVPFNVLNFAAGFAGVGFRDYMLGTLIGLIPGTAVYTYFADALLAGAAGARREALIRLLVAGVLLATLSFLPGVVAKMRRPTRADG